MKYIVKDIKWSSYMWWVGRHTVRLCNDRLINSNLCTCDAGQRSLDHSANQSTDGVTLGESMMTTKDFPFINDMFIWLTDWLIKQLFSPWSILVNNFLARFFGLRTLMLMLRLVARLFVWLIDRLFWFSSASWCIHWYFSRLGLWMDIIVTIDVWWTRWNCARWLVTHGGWDVAKRLIVCSING